MYNQSKSLSCSFNFEQCVIGHGEIGMPVLIKGHSIIPKLENETLQRPLKMSLTTFQVKDSVIRAEKHSCIEINDEVMTSF